MRSFFLFPTVSAHRQMLAITTLSTLSLTSGCNLDNSTDSNPDTGANAANIYFAAMVGADDFTCGSTYAINGKSYRVDDFRLYVYDVTLTTDVGGEIPVTLTQDGQWQYQNVAHLDFEDATADGCNGNDEINNIVTGTYDGPTEGNISGICFNLGVPYDLNHELTSQNAASPAPLNVTGMSWVWLGGHKFFKVDGVGDPGGANTSFHIHVGSTGCYNASGNNQQTPSFQCAYPNTPRICLSNFNMNSQKVTIDLAAMLADSDVTVNSGGSAGCMSGNNDPECPAIMPKLGINYVYNDGVNPVTPYPAMNPQPAFGLANK